MKKKIMYLIIPILLFMVGVINVEASSMTCSYTYNNVITIQVAYNYGQQIKCEKTKGNENRILGKCEIEPKDFVNESTGEVSCPNLNVSTTTPANKKFKYSFLAISTGSLKGTVVSQNLDDKEKKDPDGDAVSCFYYKNKPDAYTATWDGEKVVFTLTGSSIKNYDITIRGDFTADMFAGGTCPVIYHLCPSKAKKCIFSPNEDSLSIGDPADGYEDPYDGSDPSDPEDDVTPGEKSSGCGILGGTDSDTVKLLSWAMKIIRLGVPILIIVLGMIDFLQILFSGEDKVFKDAFAKFVKRLVIGVCIIFIPYIIQLIIRLSGVDTQYNIDNFYCGIIDATSGVKLDSEEYTSAYSCRQAGYYWFPSESACKKSLSQLSQGKDKCTSEGYEWEQYVYSNGVVYGGHCILPTPSSRENQYACERIGFKWVTSYNGKNGGYCTKK